MAHAPKVKTTDTHYRTKYPRRVVPCPPALKTGSGPGCWKDCLSTSEIGAAAAREAEAVLVRVVRHLYQLYLYLYQLYISLYRQGGTPRTTSCSIETCPRIKSSCLEETTAVLKYDSI
jgi:hypothetical protein